MVSNEMSYCQESMCFRIYAEDEQDGVVLGFDTGDDSGRRPACQALYLRLNGRHRGTRGTQEKIVAAALRRQLARDGTHQGGEAHAVGEGSPRKSTQLSARRRGQPPGGWGGSLEMKLFCLVVNAEKT